MNRIKIWASFSIFTMMLSACSSPESLRAGPPPGQELEGRSIPAEPDYPAHGRIGDELEIDQGLMGLAVDTTGAKMSVSINVSGVNSETHWSASFGNTLSLEEAKALLAGETIELDGTRALRWGEDEGQVMRAIERLSLTEEGAGVTTLKLILGEDLYPMEGADLERFGKAREASFTGVFSFSCYVKGPPGREDLETRGDPTFSTERCKEAADTINLWPLLNPDV